MKKYLILSIAAVILFTSVYIYITFNQNPITLNIYIEPTNISEQKISTVTFCTEYDQNAKFSQTIDADLILQLMELAPEGNPNNQTPSAKNHCTSATKILIDMNKTTNDELIDLLAQKEILYGVDDEKGTIVIEKDMIHVLD